jgi:hypothetical protein
VIPPIIVLIIQYIDLSHYEVRQVRVVLPLVAKEEEKFPYTIAKLYSAKHFRDAVEFLSMLM